MRHRVMTRALVVGAGFTYANGADRLPAQKHRVCPRHRPITPVYIFSCRRRRRETAPTTRMKQLDTARLRFRRSSSHGGAAQRTQTQNERTVFRRCRRHKASLPDQHMRTEPSGSVEWAANNVTSRHGNFDDDNIRPCAVRVVMTSSSQATHPTTRIVVRRWAGDNVGVLTRARAETEACSGF